MEKRVLVPLVLAGLVGLSWFALPRDVRALMLTVPTNLDVLFWTVKQRDAGFRALDQVPWLAPYNLVKAGGTSLPLPQGKPLALPQAELDAFMASQRTAGLVILQDGKVRLERYGLGFSAGQRWTSFSVGKSMTSTLIGVAMKQGKINSFDDPLTRYIPALNGSVYDGVSVGQLLTMTTGVGWNEDYTDPNSDVALFLKAKPDPGMEAAVSYMRKLKRVAPAGTRWNYSSGETKLVGVLLREATGQSAASYLSEHIWRPFGMEQDATWMLDASGKEMTDCCVQATTRDFARFGLFMLGGAKTEGKSIVADEYLAKALTKQAEIGAPGYGYGFQWWTHDSGDYQAKGIFGQGIFIDPKRRLVIASNSNWPIADGAKIDAARDRFYFRIQALIDAEDLGALAVSDR